MPNRILKESAFTSDKISSLTDFEFRLWTGLITIADDAGRGDARPAVIKGRIFPLRERVRISDVEDALHGLAAKGCVSLYTVDEKPYFWFPTWSEHQRIRDRKPKYPGPEEGETMPSAPGGGQRRPMAANGGQWPPESNPIQSESESNQESESNAHACACGAAGPPPAGEEQAEEKTGNPYGYTDEKCRRIIAGYRRFKYPLSDWMVKWLKNHPDEGKEETSHA